MARVLIAGDAPENALFTAFKDTGNKVVMVAMFFLRGPGTHEKEPSTGCSPHSILIVIFVTDFSPPTNYFTTIERFSKIRL